MNRLHNGGFENGMTNWNSEKFSDCGGGASTSSTSFSGSKSIITTNCGMATQTVNLAPGAQYVLSVRTRVNHACHDGDGSAGRIVITAGSTELARQGCHANSFD